MGKLNSLLYCIGQGLKNIGRNKLFSIASIATMTACLFLFGVLYFVIINVQYMLMEAETNVGVTVFFENGASEEEIKEIGEEIRAVSGVSKITYKSAEATWEEYKQTHLTEELAATFGTDNPLEDSASYEVYFHNVETQNEAVAAIRGIDGVRKVVNTEELVNTLSRLNRVLSIGSVVLIGLLLSIALFLISTTVTMGVSIRKREISIMHLIGATDLFIRAPFLVEGAIIGLVGACIPLTVLYALYYKIIGLVSDRLTNLLVKMEFVNITEVFSFLTPLSICIGVGIGFLGSYFTLNKQLRNFRQV